MRNPMDHKQVTAFDLSPPPIHRVKKVVSVRRLYFAIFLIFLSGAGGFLIGNYTGVNGFELPFMDGQFYQRDSSIEFNMEVALLSDPLDMGVNISNIQSTDPIICIEYRIEGITSWENVSFNVEYLTPSSVLYESFDHSIYYDLLNSNNNTIYVRIQNAYNITLQKSLNFQASALLS